MLKIKSIKEISSAIRIQFRVIIALLLRDTRTTFGNSSLGYLWAIITPALGVALLVMIFTLAGRQPPYGQSLALFFATGFLTYDFYKKLSDSLMNVINSNKALFLYPVVIETSAIIARFVLISLTYFVIMCFFYGVLIILDLANFPSFPINLCLAFISIALLGLGIGIMNLFIISVWQTWRNIWKIVTRPLFFISGIFFVPSFLPEYVLDYLKWNPVLHLIEGVRTAYYANYDSRVLDYSYILILSFVLIVIGLLGERLLRHKKD